MFIHLLMNTGAPVFDGLIYVEISLEMEREWSARDLLNTMSPGEVYLQVG